jgi:large subunit ribosomal protein L9
LPYKLAMPATEDNKRQIVRRAARFAAEDAARDAEVVAVVARLSQLVVRTSQKADGTGSLYGSVSAGLIAELCSSAGTPVEEKQVRLETPIKSVGEHKVKVHVHGEHEAEITLHVDASAD